MLEMNGIGCTSGCFAPEQRKAGQMPKIFTDAAAKIHAQRAMIEMKEIEAIKAKPKEERTFDERVKLAAHEIDKAMTVINDLPKAVVYVA